jgi:hypothetical protein
MISCVTHKKLFLTREQAEHALLDARVRYSYSQGNGPVAIYQCDDCGYYHLTSKGPVNDTLRAQLDSGKIDREKEAAHWTSKLKKR